MASLEKLLTESAIGRPTWADDLLQHFRQGGYLGPEAARQACETVLRTAAAVNHPRWPELVRAALDAPPLFEDVAEEIYGVRVSFEDDEGGLDQGWDEYTTAAEVAELLGTDTARAHPAWIELSRAVIEASTMPGTSVELAGDLLLPAVEADDAPWADLVPAYAAADPYEFLGRFLRHPAVLDHPDVCDWVTPYAGYVSIVRTLCDPKVAAHDVWPALYGLAAAQPSIRGDRNYAKLEQLAAERGVS